MSDPDVLVVGGGLGGSMAALSATAADPEATVVVLSPREHPFDADAGLVDVLGYTAGEREPVADPIEAIDDLPVDHPYRRLGTEALRAGLDAFDRATAGSCAGAHAEENALVPTAIGGLRPAARYPAAVEPGVASRRERTALVGFRSLPDFDPDHAAARLRAANVPFEVEPVTVEVPATVDDEAPALSIARALDENPLGDGNRSVRESVAGVIGAYLGDVDRVGVPAVLGLEKPAAVHATVAAELDVEVFEIPLGSPSVLGRRLGRTLSAALKDAGVEVRRGVDVADCRLTEEAVERVTIERSGETFEPGAVVLAPGGLEAGGVVADRTGVREPRFGGHVPHPCDRTAWTTPRALGAHEAATFGVRIDAEGRPLDEAGDPVARTLFAAGRILGGHDFAREGSVGGVALATGHVAGTAAVELALR